MSEELKGTIRPATITERMLLAEIESLRADNARLKQERNRLFVCVVDDEQQAESDPNRNYYHPRSEAIEWAFQVILGGTDVSIEERDALAKHDSAAAVADRAGGGTTDA